MTPRHQSPYNAHWRTQTPSLCTHPCTVCLNANDPTSNLSSSGEQISGVGACASASQMNVQGKSLSTRSGWMQITVGSPLSTRSGWMQITVGSALFARPLDKPPVCQSKVLGERLPDSTSAVPPSVLSVFGRSIASEGLSARGCGQFWSLMQGIATNSCLDIKVRGWLKSGRLSSHRLSLWVG